MKKLISAVLVALCSVFSISAEDVILTFSKTNASYVATPKAAWTVEGGKWTMLRFAHVSAEMNAVYCGSFANSSDAVIRTSKTLPETISEVSVTIDKLSATHINSIILNIYNANGQTPQNLIESLAFDKAVGVQTVKISDPQPDRFYDITVSYQRNGSGNAQISRVVYKDATSVSTPKTVPTLTWSATDVTADMSDSAFSFPKLTCTTDDGSDVSDLVRYSSSNTDVADIAADGTVTLVGAGSTTITASIDESDNVEATHASYNLTVTDILPPAGDGLTVVFTARGMRYRIVDYSSKWKYYDENDNYWTIENFNNGYGEWNYIRCGGEDSPETASISTDFSIPAHVTTITADVTELAPEKIGTIKVLAFSEANTIHPISEIEGAISNGRLTFDLTPQPSLKYRIVFDCAQTASDGTLQIQSITYGIDPEIIPAENATLYLATSDNANAEFSVVSDGTYEIPGRYVVFRFDVPEGHTLWHRYCNGNSIVNPIILPDAPAKIASAANTDRDNTDARMGFKQFDGSRIKHTESGALEYYTEDAKGTRSAVRTVQFSGVSLISDITVDTADSAPVYYNLQGIRIEHPVPGSVYIMTSPSSPARKIIF